VQSSPDELPPLRLLHRQLIPLKLEGFRKMSTDAIIRSLEPGTVEPLRVRRDGTVMQGNHRISVLIERGINVNALPRELYDG
jgi:hypothetical protein